MISSVLVGRGSERASIDAAYQRARQGQAVTVLVSGEAGIGKSRLVTTVTADLPGEPLLLTGCCLEVGATAAPYVPFVAILRDLVRQLGRSGVDALLPLDGSALAAWLPDLTPAPGGRTRLLEELLTLVSRAAASRPVVLVVEDLHWADASSREVFVYLARNLTDRAVLLLATVRTGELASGHPGRQLLAELGRRGNVVRVALPPLGRPHVAELLAAIGGRTPDPVRSSLIHRRSGGNPLFVEALHATEDFEGNLRTLLLDRIAALPAQAQSLLPVIAVAGTIVSDEQLLAVGELPEDDLHSALRTLVDHEQLVVGDDGYAIRHDLIREAVLRHCCRTTSSSCTSGTRRLSSIRRRWPSIGPPLAGRCWPCRPRSRPLIRRGGSTRTTKSSTCSNARSTCGRAFRRRVADQHRSRIGPRTRRRRQLRGRQLGHRNDAQHRGHRRPRPECRTGPGGAAAGATRPDAQPDRRGWPGGRGGRHRIGAAGCGR